MSSDFVLFHMDSQGERIDIESNKDLQAFYLLPPPLKLFVWPAGLPLPPSPTGIPLVDKMMDSEKLVRFDRFSAEVIEMTGAKGKVNVNGKKMWLKYRYGNKWYYQCSEDGCNALWRIKDGIGKEVKGHLCLEEVKVKEREKSEIVICARGGVFERQYMRTMRGGKVEEMVFLVSEFEMKVLKTNSKSPQRVLYSLNKIVDKEFDALLNVFMYDLTAKYYMAIGH